MHIRCWYQSEEVVSMSDMSTFYRESLYENEKIENHNAIMISGMDTFYRESLYESAHLRKTVYSLWQLFIENPCAKTRIFM